jgi:hypothetical protein
MSDKITDKFELYDILGVVVPGLVAVGMIFGALSWTGNQIEIPAIPETLQVLVLSASAIVLGQMVQAIGSLLEPFYFWTWGGRPSDRSLRGHSKRLSAVQADLLKKRLANHILAGASHDLSDCEIFVSAMALCNHKSLGRVERFNSLYAYHRALTTLLLVSTVATLSIIYFDDPNPRAAWQVVGLQVVVMLLFWFRTKQRGAYFAEEVIRMADLEVGRQ